MNENVKSMISRMKWNVKFKFKFPEATIINTFSKYPAEKALAWQPIKERMGCTARLAQTDVVQKAFC